VLFFSLEEGGYNMTSYEPGPVFYVPRSTWPANIAKALWELAESNPTPEEYKRRKAQILMKIGKR
jgi:hypothetical protein